MAISHILWEMSNAKEVTCFFQRSFKKLFTFVADTMQTTWELVDCEAQIPSHLYMLCKA